MGRFGCFWGYDLAGLSPTVPVATIQNPAPTYEDYFGFFVAISGARVLIGAYGEDADGSAAGIAYACDPDSRRRRRLSCS